MLVHWSTLVLPAFDLPSPTLYAIAPTYTPVPVTATPSETLTITLTPTATATAPSDTPAPITPSSTFGVDISGVVSMATQVNSSISTLLPVGNLQISQNGTPAGITQLAQQAGQGIGAVIVFGRELQMTQLDTGGMISFALVLLFFIIAVNIFVAVLPLLLYVAKLILQIIQTILSPF